ncbi:nuclear condensing complex subunit [Cyathus striatus]|nr:nuclear condensing complex subunit [Cyathus striatus]
MPGRTSKDNSAAQLAHLPIAIPKIFDQVQLSTANHQKNFVALYKLHAEAAQYTEIVYNGRGVKLVGERAFEDVFQRMLILVFPQKKGVAQAERIVKFVGGYTKFINEKAAEETVNQESKDEDEDEDTTASRFTAHLLKFLLKGFTGKDKIVRYRVLRIVAEMVSHLGEIDEEIYTNLRAALLDRVSDKESPVRMHALIALSKLCGAEDSSEVEDGQSVLDTLIDSLAHDPSADVRKAVLLNIPITEITLPHILSRTRDVDTTIRKVVYLSVLQSNTTQGDPPVVGPSHPRVLTIAQREQIVRNGLGDREPTVRSAAGALIGAWVENIHLKFEDNLPQLDEAIATDDKVEKNILLLLKLFDLMNSTVATDALLSVFSTKEAMFNEIEFGDHYWKHLTPESAFLARVFVDYCKATNDETRLEAALPVVTALAFHIQESYNSLLDNIQNFKEEQLLLEYGEEDKVHKEEALLDQEFIICEMLKLAVNLDYADEIGRRKMFQLVRDMLSQEGLPEGLIPACLDVLRILSVNERDLIRIVVEIVTDVRDRGEEEEDSVVKDVDAETNYGDTPATVRPARATLSRKPSAELSPEERARADVIDLKCLTLCTGMLERVDSTLDDNSTLHGILQDLVAPSAQRKELPFRQKGFVALGLCCLIAPRLAVKSIRLFMSQILNSPDDLKIVLIQSVFDMIMVHEATLRREWKKEGKDLSELIGYLAGLITADTSRKVHALICTGIAKLVFSGVIADDTAISNLIVAYLSPRTVDNQELRQCLTYFLPVFSYSSSANQERIRKIFLKTFNDLNNIRRDLDDGEDMVGAAQVVAMFVDWTDPLKSLNAVNARGNNRDGVMNDSIHIEMANDIMMALLKPQEFGVDFQSDEKKVLLQVLPKLHIPDKVDDDEIRKLKLVIYNVMQRRPLQDVAANKAVAKFDSIISEKFAQQLEDFSEEDYKKLENLKDLFDFLDSIIPEDDEVVEVVPKKRGRKRRPQSVASTSTEAESQANYSTKEKPRRNAKRRRISGSDGEDVDSENTPVPSAPTRVLPKRTSFVFISISMQN